MKKCVILFCVLILTLILASITERRLEEQQESKLVIVTNPAELIATTNSRP
ncbi:hypothetical protein [Zeaxanthinibacter enoshimensis]|uniref:hypothetical protein n=1 Tax=Zeaxanthinibacter enoshimensis TaxID=392009 RepID=UPI00356142A4